MPGRDRTGPEGIGPRTGRGAGLCAVIDDAHPMSYGRGLRRGLGRGVGVGRGWRTAVRPAGPSSEQELETLKLQAEAVKGDLRVIEQRIEELSSDQ